MSHPRATLRRQPSRLRASRGSEDDQQCESERSYTGSTSSILLTVPGHVLLAVMALSMLATAGASAASTSAASVASISAASTSGSDSAAATRTSVSAHGDEVSQAGLHGSASQPAPPLLLLMPAGAVIPHSELLAQVVPSPDSSPRLPRSPFSPPTVTSMQPHRKGVSSKMHDASLSVGRQSEGPSHPSLMRKTPPRKQATSTLQSEPEDIARPPHTMYFFPAQRARDELRMVEDDMDGGSMAPQQARYNSQAPLGQANRLHSHQLYEQYNEVLAELDQSDTDAGSRNMDEERRSRQRRVENSLHRNEYQEPVNRHGRFGEILGSSDRAPEEDLLERYDTFGHDISEELWTGHRRSATPIHPAARPSSNKSRQLSSEAGIWSRPNPRRYSRQRIQHPMASSSTDEVNMALETDADTPGERGNTPFHPGSRMSSRGFRSGMSRKEENVIVRGSGDTSASHPRMLRPRGQATYREQVLEDSLSLADVMLETNQSYEELMRTLELKGLSLTYLLRLLSSGASMNEVVKILEFPNPRSASSTTTIQPITQTLDPIVWEQWLNQELVNGKQDRETNPVAIDSRRENNPYFTDQVYAMGVHPVNEDTETAQETYTSSEISSYDVNRPYQPMNYSFEDYYSGEEEDDDEESENNGRRTNGQARIHSFTVHELPYEETYESPQTKQYIQGDASENSPDDPHPHYKQWDQTYTDDDHVTSDRLTPQSTSNVLLKNVHNSADNWGHVSEMTNDSRPLTYTVIAASAIMGSLAVFTFFVLIAYSIVKCTKKPTLNNYQVSDKKPVEITA